MANLTILEAAKQGLGTELDRAVVNIFARTSPILRVLPFRDIKGNAIAFNQEKVLPGVAFRGVNEGFTAAVGILNPVTEVLKILGGDIQVDRFIVKTEGGDSRAVQESMQLKAIAESWQTSFFKGDQGSNPKDLEGLQNRIVGNQLIDAGATSGGDALSLGVLDEAIDQCINPMALAMNKKMARRLSAAARDTSVGGFITYDKDEFGRQQTMYDDIPILKIEDSDGQDTVLPFTEANPGGGAAASTSIYILSFGPEAVTGFQNDRMEARDLGEINATPHLLTRVEWYAGLMVRHGRSAVRLQGIKDAAAVK